MSLIAIKFILTSSLMFLIGIFGIFLIKKNIIIILMSIELMLLSININFVVFSIYLNDLIGQIFALFVLTVAAAESAIGLAILVVYYRIKGIVSINYINTIKG
jgi:NADH-quinone oxidoreductase subunit K